MKLTVIVFTLMAATAMSQPNFSATDLLPVAGEQYHIVNFDGGFAGPGGASQTWNFSSVTNITDTTTMNVLTPAQTPFSADFPDANLAIQTGPGSLVFLKTSGALLQEAGNAFSDDEGDMVDAYTDKRDMLSFPLTMGSSFTDEYHSINTYMGMQLHTNGRRYLEADAWGALQTPVANYSEAVRVHTIDSLTNTMSFMGMNDTTYEVYETYQWYVAGMHWPVYGITHFTSADEDKTYGFYSFLPLLNDVPEENLIAGYKLYPNPATSEIVVESILKDERYPVIFSIVSVNGVEVLKDKIWGNTTNKYNIENLPSGTYMVQFSQNGHGYRSKFVKK